MGMFSLVDCFLEAAANITGAEGNMISFLEMVQRYPIGAKIDLPKGGNEHTEQQEVIGYEYYNGTGYLLFREEEKIDVEQCMRAASHPFKSI